MAVSVEEEIAGARAIAAMDSGGIDIWDEIPEEDQNTYRLLAKAVLTGAAPLTESRVKVETLRQAARELKPEAPDTNIYDQPLVGLTVGRCMDWLEARATAIEAGAS